MARDFTPVDAVLAAACFAPRALLQHAAVVMALLLQRIGFAAVSMTAAVRRVVTAQWKHYRKRRRRASQAGARCAGIRS